MDTLVELLSELFERYRDRPALVFKPGIRTQRYNYADLWRLSGQAAAFLRAQGIGQGDRVLLRGPNQPDD